jgi:hypothetical protein
LTLRRVLLKRSVIVLITVIVGFTLLDSSLTGNIFVAASDTSNFGYEVIGQENSILLAPKTITLCNYTTPFDAGLIVQISIYLKGPPGGSVVRAVIFANEPDAKFPQGGESVAQSLDVFNVTSNSGQWYNFTMNYPASQNTVYWFGYYSENSTQYFFDTDINHLSVTSQSKDANSTWLPVSWSYIGKSMMSLYAVYNVADPQLSPTSTPTPSLNPTSIPDSTSTPMPTLNPSLTSTPTPTATPASSGAVPETSLSFQDTFFVLLIMGAESVIMVFDQRRKKKTANKQ